MTISTSIRMSQFWLLLLLCLSSRPSHQCKSSAKSNPATTESTIKGIVKLKQPETKNVQKFRTILGKGSSQAGYWIWVTSPSGGEFQADCRPQMPIMSNTTHSATQHLHISPISLNESPAFVAIYNLNGMSGIGGLVSSGSVQSACPSCISHAIKTMPSLKCETPFQFVAIPSQILSLVQPMIILMAGLKGQIH